MKPYWKQDNNIIYQGHVLEVLKSMADESVQMCVTSPPYWGLRDYGLPPMVWDGDENCRHEWGDELISQANDSNRGTMEWTTGGNPAAKVKGEKSSQGQFCQLCNAWRGSLGLEPTPELFIDHIVQVFREVKRVLRKDGTLWLNFGDSYINHSIPGGGDPTIGKRNVGNSKYTPTKAPGLKPKDLIGIPWRVAMALQADGWYLRSAMPWVKRSAMPESATDRPASALEYMFLLTKSQKYYFDMESVRQPQSENTHARYSKNVEAGLEPPPAARKDSKEITGPGFEKFREHTPKTFIGGRNFRNTDLFFQSIEPPHGMIFCGDEPVGLDVNPQAMKEAHFATFPEKLIEPCILAGTSEKGCCVECGAPWERVVEKRVPELRDVKSEYPGEHTIATRKYKYNESGTESKTIGWKPGCKCDTPGTRDWLLAGRGDYCIVLDPFFGSGTTGLVAHKHGRNFIGIELSESYLKDIAVPRMEKATEQLKLF